MFVGAWFWRVRSPARCKTKVSSLLPRACLRNRKSRIACGLTNAAVVQILHHLTRSRVHPEGCRCSSPWSTACVHSCNQKCNLYKLQLLFKNCFPSLWQKDSEKTNKRTKSAQRDLLFGQLFCYSNHGGSNLKGVSKRGYRFWPKHLSLCVSHNQQNVHGFS